MITLSLSGLLCSFTIVFRVFLPLLQPLHLLIGHRCTDILPVAQNILRRVTLQNLATVLVVLDQDREPLHIFELVARCLRILNLATNIRIAIPKESLATLLLLVEHLHVAAGQSSTRCGMSDFELAVLLYHVDLQIVRVISQELLQIARGYLDDHVLVD